MNAKLTTATPDKTRYSARLRLLATTDLHGHLLPYDYIKDQPTQDGGLAGLSSLIQAARNEARATRTPVILLDNGDTFQGTPLASQLASNTVGPDHAIIASLNHLRYDALGLGNHDLDHGLPYLKAVASALQMPILNSNAQGIDLDPVQDSLLLPIALESDAPAILTVGILSVLPEQSAAWHSHHLGTNATLDEPAHCIATKAQALRDAGADLIIVLAHMGVGHVDGTDSDAQAAQALVHSGQIDALVLGHTHRRLPSRDYADRDGVDTHASTLGNVPAVMAGHAGSDLAVMDLSLVHDSDRGWRVADHCSVLRANDASVDADPVIQNIAQKQHASVMSYLSQPVATAQQDLHSYFSLVSPAPTQRLTACAHYQLVRDAVAGTPDAALPLLATAAAFGAGGRDGLGNYVHIPKGPVLRRHIAGLIPFDNQTVGIRITGADLHSWLEHSALLFNTLEPDDTTQMLVNPDVPAFQFDTIFGLTYQIDITAAPYARIKNLQYEDAAVDPKQQFILATSQFRVAGGGGYVPTPHSSIVCRSKRSLQDSIIDILNAPAKNPWCNTPTWRFLPLGGHNTVFLTHPEALECLEDIAYLDPNQAGRTEDGFIRLSITL